MPGAGDGTRTTWAGGEGDPALHENIGAVREELESLVDTTPGPVARAVGETPELSWAQRSRVPRPWMRCRGEVREEQFREQVGEIQP